MDEIGALQKTIHEQQARIRVLEEEEGRLRAFLESASQGVVAIDPGGAILLVNGTTEELFGYSRQELIGAPMEILLPEALRAQHGEHRTAYFASPRSRPMGIGTELKGRKKNGVEFPVEISLSFVREPNRQLALALITDISQRKRLEQQMQQAQKLESLSVLAGGIAHDFNNLLTGIIGNASLVLEQTSPDDPLYPHLQDAVEAGKQAADLTRKLMAYAGKGRFLIRNIDVAALLRDVLGLVRASIPTTIQVLLELPAPLPPISADPAQMQQLLMSLLINAAEAIGEGRGAIRLAASPLQSEDPVAGRMSATRVPPGRYVAIEVTDTGCGMDDATRARIFDPFFTTKFTGRGLGLAAARGIVEAHHGAIQVFSRPGQGSTFKVLLPAMRTGAAEAPDAG
jgi:PAS domain S-box-containing protein